MVTSAVPVSTTRPATPSGRRRAGFRGALRSELTKIRSVRSTYWSLLVLVVITIVTGALFAFGRAQSFSQLAPGIQVINRAQDISQATQQSLYGLLLGQMVIAVLGALAITSEYSTGMIRTSLSVMPRRGVSLAAKAAVFGAIALVVGLVTSFISYFAGQAILSTQHIGSTIGQPGVLRAVIGGGLSLAVWGLLSFGLGAILRHTAGAITASMALLLLVYTISGFLPHNWAVHMDKWVPLNAGGSIWENQTGTAMFSPWTGFAVFCAYAAVALSAGFVLFRKRDA